MKLAFPTLVCGRKQTSGPQSGIDQGFFMQAAARAAMHCQPEGSGDNIMKSHTTSSV